jgi:hypothetical protein
MLEGAPKKEASMSVNPKKSSADPELKNEGEGSRTATRRYDQGAEQAAKDPEHVKKAAEDAQKALEGSEGKGLREAEERGKKHEHR